MQEHSLGPFRFSPQKLTLLLTHPRDVNKDVLNCIGSLEDMSEPGARPPPLGREGAPVVFARRVAKRDDGREPSRARVDSERRGAFMLKEEEPEVATQDPPQLY